MDRRGAFAKSSRHRGAGFIASHLIDSMLKEGYEVTVMDNLSEGHVENLANLKEEPRFTFTKADLRDAKCNLPTAEALWATFFDSLHAAVLRCKERCW